MYHDVRGNPHAPDPKHTLGRMPPRCPKCDTVLRDAAGPQATDPGQLWCITPTCPEEAFKLGPNGLYPVPTPELPVGDIKPW